MQKKYENTISNHYCVYTPHVFVSAADSAWSQNTQLLIDGVRCADDFSTRTAFKTSQTSTVFTRFCEIFHRYGVFRVHRTVQLCRPDRSLSGRWFLFSHSYRCFFKIVFATLAGVFFSRLISARTGCKSYKLRSMTFKLYVKYWRRMFLCL